MADPFIAEIRMFAGMYPPAGWAFCDGQVLPINSNTALFSLIGTAFGGDGVSTFALPDLRGRAPMGVGQGPGLSMRDRGDIVGTETHQLSPNQMPQHTHTAIAGAAAGASENPSGLVPAMDPAAIPQYGPFADASLAPSAIGSTGGGQPHNNMQPYLTVNYIIALQGVFPPQG